MTSTVAPFGPQGSGSGAGSASTPSFAKVFSPDGTSASAVFGLTDASQRVVVTGDTAAPVPVAIVSLGGAAITIVADNLAVQLSHTGATPDSTQIGDGTDLLGINTDTSLPTGNLTGDWDSNAGAVGAQTLRGAVTLYNEAAA